MVAIPKFYILRHNFLAQLILVFSLFSYVVLYFYGVTFNDMVLNGLWVPFLVYMLHRCFPQSKV